MATDAIERARKWLNAQTIQLYVASSDEIVRVLSAMEDEALASGEILASTGESPAVPRAESAQSSALSEEDLFGSLRFDEDEQAAVASPSLGVAKQSSPDELTQIVQRPGSPWEAVIQPSTGREITPVSGAGVSGKTFFKNIPFEAQLAELLEEKGAEALADVVIGFADLLVNKSVLSREEVLSVFSLPPNEK
jgi:hypothetical protein